MKMLTAAFGLFTMCAQADEQLLGFDPDASDAERALEQTYDSHLSAADQQAWIEQLAREPHHVGSPAGRKVAETVHEWFKSWGYDAEIVPYEIMLPTPAVRELELVAPERYRATLTEDSLPEDPSTNRREGLLPPYNAFSTDGEAEGELVFINYGRPEDHETLERYGIDLEGKIAIAKYGRSWRGIKPKLAAEKGAIATIIYSDPADDGYGPGDVYPKGPFKHESGVQRGSVVDLPTAPGDILTPGEGATERAQRLALKDVTIITQIPVLPVSYRDAEPLLRAMGGEVVPREWVGGLPITYHLGPGPARVRLKLEFNWDMVTAYNVIARWEGAEFPGEWVVRGNHHDGWNHGAADPISGLVALLDEARSVARLAEAGSPPKRTIVYAAWDAEEPGLIGSTEWAEDKARDLRHHAVVYINTDGNGRGFLRAGGSHSLERFFDQIAADVVDPQTGVDVKARVRARGAAFGSPEVRKDVAQRRHLRLYPLGSGSDYTPFLQHLGIASLNLGFGGEGVGGSYHTLYDTYEHYTTWRDPGLAYGVALSQVAGRITLRLANAPVLPFEFTHLVENVGRYIGEIEKLADDMRKQTAETNKLLDEGAYRLALDPTRSLEAPPRRASVPHLNLAPLKNALARLETAAVALARGGNAITSLSARDRRRFNELLFTAERKLTRDHGLPGRPWYRHHIYAPGLHTGYGVKTIPGVREAIEIRDFEAVPDQVAIAAEVLDALTAHLEEAGRLLGER